MKPLRVSIVGGSLGGLFAASLLQMDGHKVKIFERSSSGLGGRGAGLVGQREVFSILRAVGCEHVARVGVLAKERVILNKDGSVADLMQTPQTQISWDHLYNTFALLIDEKDYLKGAAVASVDFLGGEAVITFEDGTAEVSDLILGADGIGSKVRQAVNPDEHENRYAGYVAWRGLFPEEQIPENASILLDRFAFYSMQRSHVLGYLVAGPDASIEPGHRRYNWVWYRPVSLSDLNDLLTDRHGSVHQFSVAKGTLPGAQVAELRAAAKSERPPQLAEAVLAENEPFIQAIFDYEAPRMVHERLVLLGDAAFVVRPHTAMGVSKAAGDALSLRVHLARSDDLRSALANYDTERSDVGRQIAAYGRRLGEDFE